LVECLNPVTVGRVNLRPFCGESVDVDVACFSISRDDHCINVYAAIVPNLHDEMILNADAVDRLFMMPESDVKLARIMARIITRSMATAQNDDDDDDKGGDEKHVITESDSNFPDSMQTLDQRLI